MRGPWDQYAQLQETIKQLAANASPITQAIESLNRRVAESAQMFNGIAGPAAAAQAQAESVERMLQQLSAAGPPPWDSYVQDLEKHAGRFALPTRAIHRLIEDARLFVPPAGQLDGGVLGTFEESHTASSLALWRLLDRFQESGVLGNAALSNRLLSPLHSYEVFLDDMKRCAEKASGHGGLGVITESLRLAEIQLLDSVGILESAMRLPNDGLAPSEPRRQPLHAIQYGELAAREESKSVKASRVTGPTRSEVLAVKSRTLLRKVIECNETAKMKGIPEIFPATTRGYEVFADLPQVVCWGRLELGQFVDCLFFLFFEGGGSDKLRFLREKGGLLDRSECGFIWRVKDLRNKWLRHDPDHGSAADQLKKWKEVGRAMGRAGIVGTPSNVEEWLSLQASLLDEALDFMEVLLDRLKQTESS
jgi:hypothetical protein